MSADPCKVAMSAHLSRTKTERDISHERRQQRKQHRYNGIYRPLQVASLHYECRPLQGGYECTCKGLWIPLYRWLWVHLQRSVNPIDHCKCTPLGTWGRRGCSRFQIPCLLCLNENSFLPTIGYSAVDSPIEIKICTNFSNFVIIHMHICRNPRTYVEPTRRVVSRGEGLGSSTISKKFNEPYAPS